MKLNMIAAAALVAVFYGGALSAADEDQMAAFEAECEKYAQEDGVAADELDEYLSQCVQDMAMSRSGDESEPAESEEDESQD